MKAVIYSNSVITKLQILKNELEEAYGKKKSVKILKQITDRLDGLGVLNKGESVIECFGIDCDYMFLYSKPNFFFYKVSSDRGDILEMFNEKEDFIYVLFGIPMRSQESIDYWGE